MSTFVDTNGGKLTTISHHHDLGPQLARIVGDHIARFGGAPACIYIRNSCGLEAITVEGHTIPIIATGGGYPGADNVSLSDDAPRKAVAA